MLRKSIVPLLLLAAALPAAASEGGGGGQALITPQIGLMFWTLLTFVILLFGLRKLAWGPLVAAIEEREKAIKRDIDDARSGREEVLRVLEEHKALVAQARRERAEATEVGRRDAERLKEEILEEGRRQKEQILAQAQVQIQAEIRQAQAELRTSAVDLAIAAAGKLITRNLDDATQRKLVEDYLAELERQAPPSRPN